LLMAVLARENLLRAVARDRANPEPGNRISRVCPGHLHR
jgi:hypothetical protein